MPRPTLPSLLVLALTAFTSAAQAASGPVVTVDTGKVQGAVDKGVANWKGIPFAAPPVTSSWASSSWRSSRANAIFIRSRLRTAGAIWPHSPSKAWRAACTARSTSASFDRASSSNGLPSDGFRTGMVSPVAAATHWLAIKFF